MGESEVEAAMQYRQQMVNRAHDKVLNSIQTAYEHRMQRQTDAEKASSVVASQSHYSKNARFNEINNGLDPRVHVSSHIHTVNPEECDVYTSLLEGCKSATITPAITHCINSTGNIEGFRFTCDQSEPASVLPMHREFFHSTMMVECVVDRDDDDDDDDIALKLQVHGKECLETLVSVASMVCKRSNAGNKPKLACIPDNTDQVMSTHDLATNSNEPLLGSYMCRRLADCKPWEPEPPRYMGLFHGYTRNYVEDFRKHRLFIVVSGGCDALTDEYYNTVVSAGDSLSVRDLHDSVETWWCRKANYRSSCRLLYEIASAFGLDVPETYDTHCYDERPTCVPTITTCHSDISIQGNGRAILTNHCVETSKVNNGILFSQYPDEGVWIFKGNPKTNYSGNVYGGGFGRQGLSTCFPVGISQVLGSYSWASEPSHREILASRRVGSIRSRDGPAIARMNHQGVLLKEGNKQRNYTLVDESFLTGLQEDCAWRRENGICELMPIAAVYFE